MGRRSCCCDPLNKAAFRMKLWSWVFFTSADLTDDNNTRAVTVVNVCSLRVGVSITVTQKSWITPRTSAVLSEASLNYHVHTHTRVITCSKLKQTSNISKCLYVKYNTCVHYSVTEVYYPGAVCDRSPAVFWSVMRAWMCCVSFRCVCVRDGWEGEVGDGHREVGADQ